MLKILLVIDWLKLTAIVFCVVVAFTVVVGCVWLSVRFVRDIINMFRRR